MSGYATHETSSSGSAHSARTGASTVSLPWLLVAAAIIGVGVMLYTEFMLTFSLIYLPSVLLFLAGGLMLFHPLSGADRSG